MKKFGKIKFILGFLISGILLYLALKKINFSETITAIKLAKYKFIIFAGFATLGINTLRSFRWKYLTENHQLVPISSFIKAYFIGFFANSVLPARLGEIIRAKTLGDLSKPFVKTGGTKSLSSVFVERVFDGIILLIFYVGIVFLYPVPIWIKRAGIVAAIIFISLLCLTILIITNKMMIYRLLEKCLFWSKGDLQKKVIDLFNKFSEGLEIIRNYRSMVIFLFLSLIVWFLEGLVIYIFMRSLNIELPVMSAFFLMILVGFGIAIPSAPGYVGVYQFVCIKGLAMWNINASLALSFALVMQFATFVPMNLVGFGCLTFSKSPFSSFLFKSVKKIEQE